MDCCDCQSSITHHPNYSVYTLTWLTPRTWPQFLSVTTHENSYQITKWHVFSFYSLSYCIWNALIVQIITFAQVIFIYCHGCKRLEVLLLVQSMLLNRILYWTKNPKASSFLQHGSFDVMCTHTIIFSTILNSMFFFIDCSISFVRGAFYSF